MEKSRATETVLTITVGFLIFYLIKGLENHWMLYTSIIVGITGLFWKWMRNSIHFLWFKLADILGFVMSRVILSAIFLVVLIPFGLLSRLFRKDLMFMKGGKQSYFIRRNHLYSAEDLENPW